MNRIRRICRCLAGLPRRAGVLLASAAAAPAVLAASPPLPPGGNKHPPLPARPHTDRCPAGGGLSFRRIVAIPFDACLAALDSWQRTGRAGEPHPGQGLWRGPIEADRDSGTCSIQVRVARGPLRPPLLMRLDIDCWPGARTALELIPSQRARPTAGYFRAGHRLLDSVTHALLAGARTAPGTTSARPRPADAPQPQAAPDALAPGPPHAAATPAAHVAPSRRRACSPRGTARPSQHVNHPSAVTAGALFRARTAADLYVGGNAMQASRVRADPVAVASASSCWRAAPGRQPGPGRAGLTRRVRGRSHSAQAACEGSDNGAGSERYTGIGTLAVRVRITRCRLACLPSILPALLGGVRSILAARRPERSSGPGISQRSSGSGWLIAGPSWSRCVPIRRGWRHAWKSSAACLSPAIRVPSRSPAPPPFGDGVATAEAYVPGGALLPSAGRSAWAFAEAFARLVTLAPRPAEVCALDPSPSWAAWNHAGAGLWPHPEDADVNLNEVAGPAWIDDTGRRARDRLRAGASEAVIGHCDWLAANLRWNADKLLVVHDWDSVTADSEAVLAGFAAALYSTVSADELATVEETQRFLAAYCDAHGRELSADELERSWAAGVWTRAYDAKYQHAAGQSVLSLTENAAHERLRRAGIG